jgi:hypothetical protein
MRVMASAEPKGWFCASENWSPITLPTNSNFPPPRMLGMMYSPVIGIMTSKAPVTTPGSVRGSVIWRNALNGRLPRSVAASTRVQSIRSSEAKTGRMNSGR